MSNVSTPRSETSCSSSSEAVESERKSLSIQDLQDIETAAMNITISHEITFDPKFKLPESQEQPTSDLRQIVKKQMERAFWEKLHDDLAQDPPEYEHTMKLVEEIKDRLLEIAGRRKTSIHALIEETMDMELYRQQAESNTFDLWSVGSFIIDMMFKTCTPAREEEIRKLRDISDLTKLFQEIYTITSAMAKDLVNFYIEAYRPIVQQENIRIERKNFAVLVQKLPGAVRNTKAWLSRAMRRAIRDTEKDCNESSENLRVRPLFVFRHAYASLLEEDYEMVKNFYPETLTADSHRVYQYKQDFDRIIIVASVLLSTINLFDTDIRSDHGFWNGVKLELSEMIKDDQIQGEASVKAAVKCITEQIFKKVYEYIKARSPAKAEQFEQTKGHLMEQTEKFTPLEAHPVYKLLKGRAINYLCDVCDALKLGTSTTDDIMARISLPSGLTSSETELKELALNFSKVVNLNYEIYKPFHGPLMEALYKEENVSY